mmetsp:Transcript_9736/g.36553  ORF Transcript_9736/g.36553 Transcript_9736/m.36553 type:complete len:212 (+) Transcript_9736:688-1323(+)
MCPRFFSRESMTKRDLLSTLLFLASVAALEEAEVREIASATAPGMLPGAVETVAVAVALPEAVASKRAAHAAELPLQVVLLPLLLVADHLVRVIHLLEGFRSAGGLVLVRVILQGQLVVRLLDLRLRRLLGDTEHLVVVLLAWRGLLLPVIVAVRTVEALLILLLPPTLALLFLSPLSPPFRALALHPLPLEALGRLQLLPNLVRLCHRQE